METNKHTPGEITERDQEIMKLIISGDFTHLRAFLLKIPTDKLNKALLGHPVFTMNTLLDTLKESDDLLSQLEDFTHGKAGGDITRLRGKLAEAINQAEGREGQ